MRDLKFLQFGSKAHNGLRRFSSALTLGLIAHRDASTPMGAPQAFNPNAGPDGHHAPTAQVLHGMLVL